MQTLSTKTQDISLGFSAMTELVKEIDCGQQNRIYKTKKYSKSLRLENEFAIKKKDSSSKRTLKKLKS